MRVRFWSSMSWPMASRKRTRVFDPSDDDAPIVQLSAAAVALQDAEWTKNLTAIDDVVKGVTSFCASMGCVCIARIRSSDKTRATIRCKHADKNGCPLRLTVKKPTGFVTYCNPNLHSFVMGTCTQAALTCQPLTRPVSPAAPPTQCQDCPHNESDPCVITCTAGTHHYCSAHMDGLAKYHVGQSKSTFLKKGCKFFCPHDESILDMQQVIAAVSKETWTLINTALQEQAVIDTQNSMTANAAPPQLSVHDAAMEGIRYRAQPRCEACKSLLTDFEACSALTCGTVRVNVRESGCGARICAWCLKVLDASELHHEHVVRCRRNPDGSIYPPQPHPEVWNASMALLTRERIFRFVETHRGEDFRRGLYAATHAEFPNFGLTEDWIALRQRWMVIMIDCNVGDADVEHFDNCRKLLLEMGYEDNDTLMRAIIFCNADVAQITYAMRAIETIE